MRMFFSPALGRLKGREREGEGRGGEGRGGKGRKREGGEGNRSMKKQKQRRITERQGKGREMSKLAKLFKMYVVTHYTTVPIQTGSQAIQQLIRSNFLPFHGTVAAELLVVLSESTYTAATSLHHINCTHDVLLCIASMHPTTLHSDRLHAHRSAQYSRGLAQL